MYDDPSFIKELSIFSNAHIYSGELEINIPTAVYQNIPLLMICHIANPKHMSND